MEKGSMLTIRRTQDIKIDISKLTDSYEDDMKDLLREKLEYLGLNYDVIDYVVETKGIADTVLNSVKKEMVQRIGLKGLTIK